MQHGLSRRSRRAMGWVAGLAGLIAGMEVISWFRPGFSSPFFHDIWMMAFVVLVYTLTYLVLEPWLPKKVERWISGLRRKH